MDLVVLEQQVKRILADRRGSSLVTNFADQSTAHISAEDQTPTQLNLSASKAAIADAVWDRVVPLLPAAG